jgi:pimeloyl-ACP methyl ester carboxylesterase
MEYLDEFGEQGPLMHFAHGNAFPPRAYLSFLNFLAKEYHIVSHKFRCLNTSVPPKHFWSWEEILDDWERLFDACGYKQMLSVGHSMGGILSLKLAARRPEFFSSLVLMDPLFLNPLQCLAWRFLKKIKLSEHFYLPAVQAKKRKQNFSSKEVMFEHYRRKRVFHNFSDENLKNYVNSIARQNEEDVELNFSPYWEARIYKTYPHISWKTLLKINVPVLIISGEESDVFSSLSKQFVDKKCPHIHFKSIKKAGHLLPMERPEEVSGLILDFLEQTKNTGKT